MSGEMQSTQAVCSSLTTVYVHILAYLAAQSASPGGLSHWLLWSCLECTNVITLILNPKYQTLLILLGQHNDSEQFRGLKTESVHPSHGQIIFASICQYQYYNWAANMNSAIGTQIPIPAQMEHLRISCGALDSPLGPCRYI